MIDIAKKHWKTEPDNKYSREFRSAVKYLQVSTDEVYGSLGPEGLFTEDTNLAPNSPNSASKTSADLLVRAYHETYGLPVNITRCSVLWTLPVPEKLIPLMINNVLNDKPLQCMATESKCEIGCMKDHCTAIDAFYIRVGLGSVQIGGNNENKTSKLSN